MIITDALLELLYPSKCVFCNKLIKPKHDGICDTCREKLRFTERNCRTKGDFFTFCVSPLYYEKYVRDSLRRFKFLGCTNYAKVYAPMLAEYIMEYCDGFDLFSWIPVSKKRLISRGYDQAELLAIEVGKRLGIEPVRILKKHKNPPPQSETGAAEKRKANILGAYKVIDPSLVEGKRILLIDDIITTGSTLSESAKTLLRSGAESVMGVTVAKSCD